MKVAIVAPSSVPYVIGGAENLWWSLLHYLNTQTEHQVELIKLPSPERNFWEIVQSYEQFSRLNLDHFDLVISTKYPAWMVKHPNHVVYLQHKLRGLYDTYADHLPVDIPQDPRLSDIAQLLAQPQVNEQTLESLFAALHRLKAQASDLPAHWFALPGPLIRAVVHLMDRIALSTQRIRRYITLSQTVAARADHFPPDATVEVLPHPSGLPTHPGQTYEYIFTTSRHDTPKRLDLLIRAYRLTQVSTPLIIAGEGPQTPRLKALAEGDERIRFVGRLSDAELVQAYANALFVPFIPYQEDLGLITLEAMTSGKAVLTTCDAGGASELVQPGINGECVQATEAELAEVITRWCQQPDIPRRYGQAAAASVAHISWSALAERLLLPPSAPLPRPHLLVLNTFSVYPPLGGGQNRIYHLYRHLAKWAGITLLALVPAMGSVGRITLGEGFVEERLPRSLFHQISERQLAEQLSASVGDISAILYRDQTPTLKQRLAELVAQADMVVLSHPYLYPALRDVYQGPHIYEAHNVEADLKESILGHSPEHLALVAAVEADCARQAVLTLACSDQDAQRLTERYGLAPNRVCVVANGVDVAQASLSSPQARDAYKQSLGLDPQRMSALFMGSYHGPNNQALEHILKQAAACPGIDFLVLGSVCQHTRLAGLSVPANVHLYGPVSEARKQTIVHASDLALNPITTGSGTNLKMLDYAANGLYILSTPFGGRGGLLSAHEHFDIAPISAFAERLHTLSQLWQPQRGWPEAQQQQIQAAREQVVRTADWSALATTYWHRLQKEL